MAGALNIDRENYPEILLDAAEQIAERLQAIGIEHSDAARIGFEVAEHLRNHWGGQLLYICKGTGYEISQQHLEIWQRSNGSNYDWLAREYNLSVQQVYKIVKRVGAAERAKRQGSLLPE
ncbi:MAG: transcriptional regulator [Betaproteobacteria bacterium]|nr:transcriptional regulator [Betaproteobacteria bacterium]